MKISERRLNLLMDLYQLTMSQIYFKEDLEEEVVFDMFFRKVPEQGGFAIMAGVEQVIEYIEGLSFNTDEIQSLRELNIFEEDFLSFLSTYKFKSDIYAIPEGTPIFPNEPIVTVKGRLIDCQMIETMLLLTINHQSLIATKTNRIVRVADGRGVMEFGARRAQGYDGAVYGARASYIAGAIGTATTMMHHDFNIPVFGTMAHSFIQRYGDEYKAFEAYAKNYPDSCTLLVDTYSVLKSGVPNAIKVAKEVLEPMGKRLKGIRLDSGDMAYLSKKCRKMLDEANMQDCKIIASNSLDEYTITSLLQQGAKIDIFGVGERLITSKAESVFGGVYKIGAVKEKGEFVPRIKLSENVEKVTNPGYKTVWRLFDNETGKAIADVITLADEVIDDTKPYTIFDPVHTWKKKEITNFTAKKLQVPVILKGEVVYNNPKIEDIKKYCEDQINTLWDEVKRLENPHAYYVDLSKNLWDLKNKLIQNYRK